MMKINKERLVNQFLTMTAFDSETFHERDIADYLKKELENLGMEVYEDDAGVQLKAIRPDYPETVTGNVYGFLKGTIQGEPLLLSAHMDTVSPGKGKKAVMDEAGCITSEGETVLGADDLSGIVSILEAIRVIKEEGIPYPDIEVLFPVAEEFHGQGSRLIEYTKIRSKEAYVFDLSGEIGIAATAAPTILYYEIMVHGKSAHAGFCPELGVHAIRIAVDAVSQLRQGWLDHETTLNIGTISGGTQSNIVPESCKVVGEIRSLDDSKAMAEWERLKQIFETAAEAAGGSVEIRMEKRVMAYAVDDSEPVVQRFKKVCAEMGLSGETVNTLGGSDNNHFAVNGIRGIVAACGMNDVHTTKEYTTVDQLMTCTELAIRLIAAKGA